MKSDKTECLTSTFTKTAVMTSSINEQSLLLVHNQHIILAPGITLTHFKKK